MNEPFWVKACLGVCAVALVVVIFFLIYLFGYGAGLWPGTCALDSSQPKCVARGWGSSVVVHPGGKRP